MPLGFLNRQRLWTVYRPTGDPKRPLKPVACVRANAKSIAAGKVVDLDPRLRNNFDSRIRKARREALVVVEGCFAPGPVLRGGLGTHKPTIYEVLREKLKREPTHNELVADVRRILDEGLVERATRGQLPHQRRRRR